MDKIDISSIYGPIWWANLVIACLLTWQIWTDQFFNHFEFKIQNNAGSVLLKKVLRSKIGIVDFGWSAHGHQPKFLIKFFSFIFQFQAKFSIFRPILCQMAEVALTNHCFLAPPLAQPGPPMQGSRVISLCIVHRVTKSLNIHSLYGWVKIFYAVQVEKSFQVKFNCS